MSSQNVFLSPLGILFRPFTFIRDVFSRILPRSIFYLFRKGPPARLHAIPADMPTPTVAFKASDYENDGKIHMLIAATGSVATIKIPLILEALSHYQNISIRLVFTKQSLIFLPPLAQLLRIRNVDGIHLDHHEWPNALSITDPSESLYSQPPKKDATWSSREDPILHIELRRWGHVLLIAPLSANSLAKLANGISDNLLLSLVRAWETHKPIYVAPAMNTLMWDHPITAKHIGVLENEWTWYKVIRPVEKRLACGDSGSGGMQDWNNIVRLLIDELKLVRREEDEGLREGGKLTSRL